MSGMDDISFTTRTSALTTNVITQQDFNLLLAALTGATAVTLPAPGTVCPSGRTYMIYKDASAQTVTITGAGGSLIDGGANTTLASGAAHAKTFVTDGTNWFTSTAY